MQRRWLFVACALTVAAMAGCGPAIPEQAEDCPTDFPEDFPEERSVEAGDTSSGQFVPYGDGAEVTLLQGGQGAIMIAPSVRVKATPGDGDEACYRVRLENDYLGALPQDPEEFDANQFTATFIRAGDFLVSDGALYHPFVRQREDLEGITMGLTTVVQGDGFEGSKTVKITLK
jgi:hypothetical protein